MELSLKEGWGIIYFHTNEPFPVLSFSECYVCPRARVCLVYLHHFYQYYLFSQEEPSLIASNQ